MAPPIFLAGVDRSGIGLLGEVLETHPDVSMTRRTNFWSFYYGRFGDLSEADNVERALDEMMRNVRMRVFAPDRARLATDLADSTPTYPRLFELLQLQLMERRGCSRWGDKSLSAEEHASTIMSAYPDARMVHVMRDPRDRYASHKFHRGASRGGVGAAAALWRWSDRLADVNQRRFGDRYHVVRYEDLVTSADEVLEEVRVFLELTVPASSGGPLEEAAEPLRVGSIGRYRTDLSATERRYLEVTTGRRARRRGYPVGPEVSSRTERVRFWTLVLPVQVVNSVLSRMMKVVRRRLGRGPSTRRLVDIGSDPSRPDPSDRERSTSRP